MYTFLCISNFCWHVFAGVYMYRVRNIARIGGSRFARSSHAGIFVKVKDGARARNSQVGRAAAGNHVWHTDSVLYTPTTSEDATITSRVVVALIETTAYERDERAKRRRRKKKTQCPREETKNNRDAEATRYIVYSSYTYSSRSQTRREKAPAKRMCARLMSLFLLIARHISPTSKHNEAPNYARRSRAPPIF